MDLSSYSSDENLRMWALEQARVGNRLDSHHNERAFAVATEIERFVRTGKRDAQLEPMLPAQQAAPVQTGQVTGTVEALGAQAHKHAECAAETPTGPKVDQCAAASGDTSTSDSATDVDGKKRKVEELLARVSKIGIRVRDIRVCSCDGGVDVEWHCKVPPSSFLIELVQVAAEDISAQICALYRAGYLCTVKYDDAGFPCVSWSPVKAAD
ncbi:hypothetical protein [Komagataeibacter xylinus]|uniref:hypothetical protein n=1 Tax=Komagataeibacter xylinus TaxID=28448 RepID=UPI000FDF8FC1|nr:hypothetical protein [Komagataeibacter xylinus]AZV39939.1 hypothetical protein CXP35_15365 [Komagataeibacter xylinus]